MVTVHLLYTSNSSLFVFIVAYIYIVLIIIIDIARLCESGGGACVSIYGCDAGSGYYTLTDLTTD